MSTATPRLFCYYFAFSRQKKREGRILVKPLAGLPQGEFDQIIGRHGGKAPGRLRNLDVHVIQVPARAEDAVAKALMWIESLDRIFITTDFIISF